ncbi:glycosyltransferase [Reichenbachiella carrageenanivorans]|uniref:Glycosyltransferase n=1 Tax=Reichenbachiella carrageenanivorans TaxID=2979869 RepID=A0ABY6CYA1_9BACT|nr:glycosyltransferase [Reichenbachiella carrageenanivorans]UXX78891.1 glycosyltransferase [Reichenbachiella carrageenanivorans]
MATQSPFVSILIALRNEQNNVPALCQSLKSLTYPVGQFEILFGNDDSEDDTLEELKKHKPDQAKIFSYSNDDTGAYGKQRVLSALATQAKGTYVLFTDADMIFDPEWVQAMLIRADSKQALTVGLTKVDGEGWFAQMQNMDWLINECVLVFFSKLGVGLTAWGNNMLIAKSTYESIGGHSQLDPTIVEDVALLQRLKANGGQLVINTCPKAVASTKPELTWVALFHQRKRWMQGLSHASIWIWLAGFVKLLIWPSLLFLLLQSQVAWGLVALLLGSKYLVFNRITQLTKCHFSITHLLIFEIYELVFYFLTFAFYLFPTQIVWKGRKYQ